MSKNDNILTEIKFTNIYDIVDKTLNFYNPTIPNNIDDVIEIDKISRMHSLKFIKRYD